MDTTSIILIGIICSVCIAFICVLIYIFQPKHTREVRMFSFGKKDNPSDMVINTSSDTHITSNNVNQYNSNSIDSLSFKALFNDYELEAFNKIYRAFRNKDILVFSKVNFSDFVSIQKISASQDNEFYRILPYLKADFLLCNANTGKPICIVKDDKIPIENAYKTFQNKIADKLKIKYIAIDGVDDVSIAKIFQIVQN